MRPAGFVGFPALPLRFARYHSAPAFRIFFPVFDFGVTIWFTSTYSLMSALSHQAPRSPEIPSLYHTPTLPSFASRQNTAGISDASYTFSVFFVAFYFLLRGIIHFCPDPTILNRVVLVCFFVERIILDLPRLFVRPVVFGIVNHILFFLSDDRTT